MNCPDFERVCNERIDDREARVDHLLDAHAAACPACRAVRARYDALSRAIQALTPPGPPSLEFADRVVRAAAASPRLPAWRLRARGAAPLAAAAAVVLAVSLGLRTWTGSRDEARPVMPAAPPAVAQVRSIDQGDLTLALAAATSATWDLAREASAPAARVGRQVIGSAEFPGRPSPPSLPAGLAPGEGVWESVGDRVNAGVRPLGGTARHAFGFLLGDAPDENPVPPPPPAGA